MAVFETQRPIASGHGLSAMLTNLVARFNDWNDARITRNELGRLTDRQLDDLGLTRDDVDAI